MLGASTWNGASFWLPAPSYAATSITLVPLVLSAKATAKPLLPVRLPDLRAAPEGAWAGDPTGLTATLEIGAGMGVGGGETGCEKAPAIAPRAPAVGSSQISAPPPAVSLAL